MQSPQPPPAPPRAGDPPANRHLGLAALAIALLAFLPWLGSRPMDDRADGRIPLIARDMVDTGRILPAYLLGEMYLKKPPLAHLLTASVVATTGRFDLWVVRLPSVLAAALAVWLTFRLGSRLVGPAAGFAASLCLASGIGFATQARSSELEMLLAALSAVSVLALCGPLLFDEHSAGPWLLSAGAVGLASWTKGPPIALLFPLLFVIGASIVRRRAPWTHWRGMLFLLGGAVIFSLGFAVPWARANGGWRQLFDILMLKNVEHQRGPFYYLPALPLGLLPAGMLLPWMIARWRRLPEGVRALAVTGFLGVIAFSLSRSKQSHYLLPLAPLFAVWAGTTLVALLEIRPALCLSVATGVGLLPLLAAIVLPRMRPGVDATAPLWPIALIAAATGGIAAMMARRVSRAPASGAPRPMLILAALAPALAGCLFFDGAVGTALGPYRSPAAAMHEFHQAIGAAPVASLDRSPASMYHLGRTDVIMLGTVGDAARFLAAHRDGFVILEADSAAAAGRPHELDAFEIRRTSATPDHQARHILLAGPEAHR